MRSHHYIILGIFLLVPTILSLVGLWKQPRLSYSPKPSPQPYWAVRSIDTMKYSRDLAREKMSDSSFDLVIDQQVKNIAKTGASHIAVATPYDPEFVPFLRRWVKTARQYQLKVWFRGNAAGWEGWFDYPRLGREGHLNVIQNFILDNGDLFESGDIFTPCPECENGGEGDPRHVGDVSSYREFLIAEYQAAISAFRSVGKNVQVGYFSMNYDVATLVMDKSTTEALGGIVAIDHYVASPEQLALDLQSIAHSTGGKIYLGEWGAPIPDIHGALSPDDQAAWIRAALDIVRQDQNVIGLNYWVNTGGSTAIWDEEGNASPSVSIITEYYSRLEMVQ